MMMRILHTKTNLEDVYRLLDRRVLLTEEGDDGVGARVKSILETVKIQGDQALLEFTERFDGVRLNPENLRVSVDEIEQARSEVSDDFIEAMRLAQDNISAFHRRQLPQSWMTFEEQGIILGQRMVSLERVGLYVPGGIAGTTPLVSTFLMNAIPALVAGVDRLIVCTPPRRDGTINPYILAAAQEMGIAEIYKVGGAQAIAAMAFGTATVPRVDKIAGPGNAYVAAAKRQVYGFVGLDTLAGPSEIVVIADETANPRWVASDLLSQAEHGPNDEAGSILLTPDQSLAESVVRELEQILPELGRAEIARNSLAKCGGVVVTADIEESIKLANFCAPEHLELYVAEPFNLVGKVRHAGAVFLGPYSPEPIGDYVAGTNHVLPTMGLARFASALGVYDFLKQTSIISYTREGLAAHGPAAVKLARAEGLEAHARSVEERLTQKTEE
jgi:histidinol dehydrogenase